jgi:hypothetical protein
VELLVAEYNPGKKALLVPSLSRQISENYLVSLKRLSRDF